jgi:hypothetical protein
MARAGDQFLNMISKTESANTSRELFDNGAAPIAQRLSSIMWRRRQGERFPESHSHTTRPGHEAAFGQNEACSLDICRKNRNSEFTHKETDAGLEWTHFTIGRSRALGIKDECAAGSFQEPAARVQTMRQGLWPGAAFNRNHIHPRRNGPANASRLKEIVAGAEKRETPKTASAGCHQGRAVGVARMIAAQQKRPSRQVVTSLNHKGTIRRKEHPAKTFKRGTARKRCLNRSIRAGPASHSAEDITDLEHPLRLRLRGAATILLGAIWSS